MEYSSDWVRGEAARWRYARIAAGTVLVLGAIAGTDRWIWPGFAMMLVDILFFVLELMAD